MILAWPLALLLLLGAIPIVLAFLKRPPPRRMMVSSLLLMEALATAPKHRKLPPLREMIALLLFLLALGLMTAAVALRPDPPPPGRLVLLDTSASMSTLVDGETRYEAALDAMSDALQSTGSGPITLITTSPARIRVRQAQTADPILHLARDLRPSGEDGDVGLLLRALCTDEKPLLIVIAEALPLPDLDCPILRPALLQAEGNRGITGMPLRPAGAVALYEAHLEVVSQDVVEVEITAEGIQPTTLTLTPTDVIAQRILRLSLPEGGTLTATLVGTDPFPGDDQVTIVVPPPSPVRTRLVTNRPEGFLARALQAHPGVVLEIVPPATPASPVDLLVLEEAAPIDGANRVLALLGGLESVPIEVIAPLEKPILLPADETALLTRYIDPTGLRIEQASRLGVPEGGQTLLSTTNGPVGVLLPGDQIVALGLSLSDSDLALRLDFAHLIANVVEWAQPPSAALPRPVGVLSRTQTRAQTVPMVALPDSNPPPFEHRAIMLFAGLFLMLEWAMQAWGKR